MAVANFVITQVIKELGTLYHDWNSNHNINVGERLIHLKNQLDNMNENYVYTLYPNPNLMILSQLESDIWKDIIKKFKDKDISIDIHCNEEFARMKFSLRPFLLDNPNLSLFQIECLKNDLISKLEKLLPSQTNKRLKSNDGSNKRSSPDPDLMSIVVQSQVTTLECNSENKKRVSFNENIKSNNEIKSNDKIIVSDQYRNNIYEKKILQRVVEIDSKQHVVETHVIENNPHLNADKLAEAFKMARYNSYIRDNIDMDKLKENGYLVPELKVFLKKLDYNTYGTKDMLRRNLMAKIFNIIDCK